MLTRPLLIGCAFSMLQPGDATLASDAFVGIDNDEQQQPFVATDLHHLGGATTYQVHCIACHALAAVQVLHGNQTEHCCHRAPPLAIY